MAASPETLTGFRQVSIAISARSSSVVSACSRWQIGNRSNSRERNLACVAESEVWFELKEIHADHPRSNFQRYYSSRHRQAHTAQPLQRDCTRQMRMRRSGGQYHFDVRARVYLPRCMTMAKRVRAEHFCRNTRQRCLYRIRCRYSAGYRRRHVLRRNRFEYFPSLADVPTEGNLSTPWQPPAAVEADIRFRLWADEP